MEATHVMTTTVLTTLRDAKLFLRDTWEDGATCPCCSQRVQKYSRPITSAMACALILLYNKFKNENNSASWVHMESFLKDKKGLPASIRGDVSKLRYWNLIQPSEESEGYYRITSTGILFVEGKVTVISNVTVFNNKIYGSEGKQVTIKDCLKKKFNYEKLMAGEL